MAYRKVEGNIARGGYQVLRGGQYGDIS